jgi:hypothetical protein
MCAFVDYCFLHSRETVEDDGTSASLDIVEGLLDGEEAYCARDGEAVKCLEGTFGCHCGYVGGSMWQGESVVWKELW